jgi:hypothetical protein
MDDFRDLLSILSSHNVDFLIIGAHALAFYGHPRATKDVDLWVRRDLQNAEHLAEALREFGTAISDEDAQRFASEGRQMIRLGFPPQMVDILNFAGEESFEEVWSGRVSGTLLDVQVHYPSKTALIKMKLAAGRPQDLVDVQRLQG